ncbi:DUF2459 domain-containing protein [Belnapia sp. T6]|uniref:DUF2459 domain-containing protein n=1 Tax=Belnapia mucosa TaxID=2804532 RepID=A0ABS1V773_9PROT|nr:DUF2459 domain-containing protein [Belnapia mucosa]MBL6457482.1 DUF2459 domain-containing protein [Belnapia mucosa]
MAKPGRRVLLLLLLLLPACVAAPPASPVSGPAVAEIQVIGRDWHTDIAVPADDPRLPPVLAAVARDFPGVRHLVFGFGDRAWLLGRDASPLGMLRALLPGAGAILVTALARPPEEAFGPANVVTLPVSRAELDRLEAFLAASIDAPGRPGDRLVPLADGPYPGSLFHPSPVIYSATRTCNTWTAEALAASGLPVSANGVLLAGQVMARARRVAALRRGKPSPESSPLE